jgi:zinc protease
MSSMTRIALALLVALSATACSVSRSQPSTPDAASPVRHVLPNGVRVVIQEHRSSDVVALQLWVRAGGRDETPSELGLAHYLEHLLFKGTATRPTGFIDSEVEGVGGRMNAGTSLDYTYYHMLLPARRAVAGIETLADISVNASLDTQVLESEKRVVLEEMRFGEDNPSRSLLRQLYAAAFPEHPYGRAVIGQTEVIQRLTREQLLGFYRRYYVPEAFTLVVVGAIEPDEVLAAATRAFGRMPRLPSPRLPVPVPASGHQGRVELTRPVSQAYLALGWLAPRIDHADTPAVDLVVSILGQGRGSRLTQALRERLGLVNTVSSGYSALEGAGLVSITTQLDPRNLERAEAALLSEVERVRAEGVTETERRRAITAAEARRAFLTETAEGRAWTLGQAETIWRLEDELAYVHRLRSVTAEQLLAAARRYFDPNRYARVVFVPATKSLSQSFEGRYGFAAGSGARGAPGWVPMSPGTWSMPRSAPGFPGRSERRGARGPFRGPHAINPRG